MRWLAILALLGGCRQILGIDDLEEGRPIDAMTPVADAPPLFDADLSARKKVIAVDPTQVAEALSDFPVWVALDDPQIAARARADGSDIHFRLADGSETPYEIQRWDPTTGHLEAWVRVSLDVGVPTMFEIHYGEPVDTPPPPDPASVFSQQFAAVWHLDDDLSTTAIADATGDVPGTTAGGLDATASVPGRVGRGISFDGVDDLIQFTNPLNGGTQHTISAWIDQRAGENYDSIVTVGNPAQNQSRWFHSFFLSGTAAVGMFGNDWGDTGVDLVNAGWTMLHWTYGSNRLSRFYVNGQPLLDTHTHANGVNTQGTGGYIGYAPPQWGPGAITPSPLNGSLDDVRIATTARSAGYILTEYRNQRAPATFYSVGPEQLP
jgi:hypothetical protein